MVSSFAILSFCGNNICFWGKNLEDTLFFCIFAPSLTIEKKLITCRIKGIRLFSKIYNNYTWRDYEHGAYKIKGKSAIPEGRYAVVISYSPKFKQWLPLLLGGPEFNKKWSGIRIHAGNSVKDTEGCILIGENREVGKVLNSRKWLYELKHRIVEAKDRGEAVWLTIL